MNSISYIIPHFNSVERIQYLLESIQLNNDDEILVIDDCSTEINYKNLISLKNKFNFRLLKTAKNSGAGKARNIGIKEAKNKWLIFADSDDVFVKNYKKYVDLYLKSSSDIVYFNPTSKRISVNRSVTGDRHSFYSYLIEKFLNHRTEENLNNLKYKMVVPWSKMIDRQFIIENSLFFDEVSVSNDVMFSTKIGYYSKKIEVSLDTVYCCIEVDSSMTADTSFSKTLMRINIFKEQYYFLKEKLNKQKFDNLTLVGVTYFIIALKSNYSFSQYKDILVFFKKNKIPIISFKYIYKRLKRVLIK